MAFRSGFVCILGRPNAGKSTLLNALAGEKLAIVSPKPQTTRNRVLGVINVPQKKRAPGAQVILIDTPGVHRADSSLGRKMMSEVRDALHGCDLVLVIVDASKKMDAEGMFLFDLLRGDKGKLLPLIEHSSKLHEFQEVIPISARKREGLDLLIEKIVSTLP